MTVVECQALTFSLRPIFHKLWKSKLQIRNRGSHLGTPDDNSGAAPDSDIRREIGNGPNGLDTTAAAAAAAAATAATTAPPSSPAAATATAAAATAAASSPSSSAAILGWYERRQREQRS
jgi:hypothetical protein